MRNSRYVKLSVNYLGGIFNMREYLKTTLTFILGGTFGLFIVDILKDNNYLTWNKFFILVGISIVGSFIGTVMRNLSRKRE